MAHTYEELKKKTVAELRELAGSLQHERFKGIRSSTRSTCCRRSARRWGSRRTSTMPRSRPKKA